MKKRIIFNSNDVLDDDIRKEVREMLQESNENVTEDDVTGYIQDGIYDEKDNLDMNLGYGHIIAYAKVWLWDGKRIGIKLLEPNLREIIGYFGNDDIEIYADRYNIRAIGHHHDGKTEIVFRWIDDAKNVDVIYERLNSEKTLTEDYLFKKTKSILPQVKEIYGW